MRSNVTVHLFFAWGKFYSWSGAKMLFWFKGCSCFRRGWGARGILSIKNCFFHSPFLLWNRKEKERKLVTVSAVFPITSEP